MLWLVLAVLALVPLLGFVATYRLSGRRWLPAVIVAALIGAALGAFLASAGSAMATSVNPTTAMLRGGGMGLLGGVTVGGVAAAVMAVWQRRTS